MIMNIIIIGEDSFSVRVFESLVEAGHSILTFVTPVYSKHQGMIRKVAEQYGVKYNVAEDVNHEDFIEYLRTLSPELIVTVHFERLLKPELIDIAPKGCINIHPSLLPLYKGLAPQHWPLINGDKETGITVHFIDEGMDTGNIILQEKIQINDEDYISDLQLRILPMYGSLVCKAIDKINNKDFETIKQSGKDSYYPRLKLKDTWIDCSRTKKEIYNLIRGISYPYMGAHYSNYIIWRAEFLSEKEENKYNRVYKQPGFYIINEETALLKLVDGFLLITEYE